MKRRNPIWIAAAADDARPGKASHAPSAPACGLALVGAGLWVARRSF